jgi:hypothetical protein
VHPLENKLPISEPSRRQFLRSSIPASGIILLPVAGAFASQQKKAEEGEEDVSTNEDLMREHGILKRVLLAL